LRKAAAGQAGVKEPRHAAGRSDGQAAGTRGEQGLDTT
jgi:hypothetical protein